MPLRSILCREPHLSVRLAGSDTQPTLDAQTTSSPPFELSINFPAGTVFSYSRLDETCVSQEARAVAVRVVCCSSWPPASRSASPIREEDR